MTPPPIFCRPQDAHLLPTGLSPKRALGFLAAAALVVLFAGPVLVRRARNEMRLRRELTAEVDAWLKDVFADEERRQP